MSLTTDPQDPKLGKGADSKQVPQNEVYLVLSKEERAKGYIRPVRTKYVHKGLKDVGGNYVGGCGVETKMNETIAETYARDPKFYGATYCVGCKMHRPVQEFVWSDTEGTTNELVGS